MIISLKEKFPAHFREKFFFLYSIIKVFSLDFHDPMPSFSFDGLNVLELLTRQAM